MKNISLFLLLLLSGMAGAQIVDIPDANFKARLLAANFNNGIAKNSNGNSMIIDANGDGEIQVSEALEVWELNFFSIEITSAQGINAFVNLRRLDLDTFLDCQILNLNLPNLERLYVYDVDFQEINLQAPALKILNVSLSDFITSLDTSGLPSLEELTLDYSGNATINPFVNINLKKMKINNVHLNEFDFSALSSLEDVWFETSLNSFNFYGLTGLKKIYINAAGYVNNLNLEGVVNLEDIILDIYNGVSIDLSDCVLLKNVNISMGVTGNTISYINFKNGVTDYDDFTINLNTDQQAGIYICIDEGNESLFPSNVYANPNILVSTYCSFTPGGNYNTIEGNLTFDSDNNGCGLDDAYSGFVRMNIDNGLESFSTFTASGLYNFYVQSGTFTLTPQIDNEWFIATPPSATINLATVVNSTMTQNFCIIANGFHPDVEVVIVPIVAAQPGFDANYKVVYRNKGNQALSGTVTLNYDDAVLDYVSAIPVESTSSTGLLSWNYVNLLPFESRSILVTLNVNGPMETPAINLNDVLAFSASVTPATGDETPTDNAFALEQVVVGSYDPNDITCLEGESVDPSKIGEYLHYNINFENTGSAPATFIVVKDMIDEAKFDINTLQVLYASHAVETRVTGNKVEFYFGDINLAALGKGNVVFKIKTLNTLQVNDDVAQQADIFFDYNWPIETTEAVTVFEVLRLGEYETDNSVKVYPNPAKDRVTITAASQVESIEVYDMQGKLLQSAIVNGTVVEMDLSSRNTGVYFVKVETDRGMKVEKVVKE